MRLAHPFEKLNRGLRNGDLAKENIMRDYKLRKKVFNEYPTTAEVQNMIAQGGGGETREPAFSFDVVAETPHTLSAAEAAQFLQKSMTLDLYVGDTKYDYDGAEQASNLLTISYYSENDDELIFSVNMSGMSVSVTSSVSGTLSAYIDFFRPLVIHGTYSNDTITTYDPAILIIYNLLMGESVGAILQVQGNNAHAIGYLTASHYFVGSTETAKFSCDIDINGKFDFTVDGNYHIVGSHGTNEA